MKWARALLGVAAVAAFTAIGVVIFTPEAPPEPTSVTPDPVPAEVIAAASPGSSEPPQPPRSQAKGIAERPRFDVVRIEPDGAALFAGVAAPDAEVEIRSAGEVVATARADAAGEFVAFGTSDVGEGLQTLEIVAAPADAPGMTRAGAPVFVAPVAGDEPATRRPAVFRPGPAGVEVLQQRERSEDQEVTLDTVSYDAGGDIRLGGRGEALKPLRVFADAMMIAETRVSAEGRWTTQSRRSLSPGDYTLRIEALSETGAVEFVIEAPFRRERREDGALAPGEVVVQPGDSLWRLAQNLYGSGPRYTVIYGANADRIRNPDLIFPGQVFEIPSRSASE